jgi:hypothetical protein
VTELIIAEKTREPESKERIAGDTVTEWIRAEKRSAEQEDQSIRM